MRPIACSARLPGRSRPSTGNPRFSRDRGLAGHSRRVAAALASMWHWRHIQDRASLRILWSSVVEEHCRTCPHRETRSQCPAYAQPVGQSAASSKTSSNLLNLFTGFVSHGLGRLLVATRSCWAKDLGITSFPPDPGRAPGTEGRWHGPAVGDGRAGRPHASFNFDQPYRVESAPARLA